jgi:hypothetical protein
MPEAVGHGPDGAADRLCDGVSNRVEGTDSSFAHVADVSEEGFRGSGAVGADENVGSVPVGVGNLRERLVEHRDVVGGSVGAGVAGPQQAGQCLAGVGQEAQQWVEAESALVGGCGLLFLGVAGDQRGIEVQDQPGQSASRGADCGYALAMPGGLQPGDFGGLGAGRSQRSQRPLVGVGEQPPGRRCRGNGAEHLCLVPQYGQIRDGLAAVGEHHGQIGGDPARIMTGPARPKRPERGGVRGAQPGGISEIRQQPCPGMPDHPRTIGTDVDLGTRPDTLHVRVPSAWTDRTPQQGSSSQVRKALSRFRLNSRRTQAKRRG